MSAHQPISPTKFEQLFEDAIKELKKADPEHTSWEAYIYRNIIKELYPLLFVARLEIRKYAGPSNCENILSLAAIEKAMFEMQIPLQKEIENAETRARQEEAKQLAERDIRQAERQQGDDA